ncbi:Alpha/Beta hydrolase protein [Emericellopsis atlantica]|uniref:Alpha/Beta hydrolase protein n=1 Tax=Emericellopsis atlantica TaxID=2614577 RepID=A0A9P7ZE86_9HYPO|nr:Alpha/Beta hydrolase protein [Emericellopsis atlantica]KAG9250390.1 Alpha/Beta hydrolase protein [Emericellopsis atlantica]
MSSEAEGTFEVDGVSLYTKTWTPTGPTKARLIFIHGFSEHINRYNDFFPTLAAAGIQVLGFDQRGWGRSAKDKSDWGLTGPTARVVADVAAFIKHNTTEEVPVFVMGHSMGGGEICTLMADEKYADVVRSVRGWILECPFIGFTKTAEPSTIKIMLGRLAGMVLPRHQLTHVVPPEDLSRDQAVVESIRNDPLCHNTGTLEGLASLLDRTALLSSGTVKVSKNVKSILLQHGTGDLTCSFDAAMKWLEQQTEVEDKVAKPYEGGYHQLHSDLCKEEFGRDLVAWILERSEGGARAVEAKL